MDCSLYDVNYKIKKKSTFLQKWLNTFSQSNLNQMADAKMTF